MVVSSLIHCVEQFLLAGLISLAIVLATIRAYFAKILASLRAAGLSPLFIFSLLGILSIYGCIATIQCCASQQISADGEECASGILVIDLEEDLQVSNSRFKAPVCFDWLWDGLRMMFHGRGRGDIKPSLCPTILTYATSRCACMPVGKSIDGHIHSMTVSNNIVSE
jgi:hypothetical protein